MAKFKPGDKVRYLIGTDKDKSKVHTVLETTIEGGREMVWFDDDGRGGNGIWADSLVKVNSRARNAKFKVGDVVSVKREAAEMIDNPALARKRGRVTKVLPGGYYEVDGELGATGLELTDAELTLANSRACNGVRSRNAVVAKALNACGTARNALDQAAVSRALTDAVRAVGVLQRVAQDNSDERQAKIAQKAKSVLLGEI